LASRSGSIRAIFCPISGVNWETSLKSRALCLSVRIEVHVEIAARAAETGDHALEIGDHAVETVRREIEDHVRHAVETVRRGIEDHVHHAAETVRRGIARREIERHALHGQWAIDRPVRRVARNLLRVQRRKVLRSLTRLPRHQRHRRHQHHRPVLLRANRGDFKPCYWHRHVINTANSIAVA
jgi:hypothetical protein